MALQGDKCKLWEDHGSELGGVGVRICLFSVGLGRQGREGREGREGSSDVYRDFPAGPFRLSWIGVARG